MIKSKVLKQYKYWCKMDTQNNTGLGLIKSTIERVQNQKSLFASALKKLVNSSEEEINAFLGKVAEKLQFLKLISGGSKLILRALSGKEVIAKAKNVFVSIDSDFKNWNADQQGPETKETECLVYEMEKDANFAQMFGSLNSDLEKLCMSQHQIIEFAKEHSAQLRKDGYATLFLFKANDQFFVASVRVCPDGLSVFVRRFEFANVWDADDRIRVVVPQLAV